MVQQNLESQRYLGLKILTENRISICKVYFLRKKGNSDISLANEDITIYITVDIVKLQELQNFILVFCSIPVQFFAFMILAFLTPKFFHTLLWSLTPIIALTLAFPLTLGNMVNSIRVVKLIIFNMLSLNS